MMVDTTETLDETRAEDWLQLRHRQAPTAENPVSILCDDCSLGCLQILEYEIKQITFIYNIPNGDIDDANISPMAESKLAVDNVEKGDVSKYF